MENSRRNKMVQCNFGKETSEGYQVYPASTYKVVINDWERSKARTGTPQIRWKAQIIEGPFKGKPITEHTPLTEKALWKVANLIYGAGVDARKLNLDTSSTAFDQILNACKGRKSYWLLSEDTDNNGKLRNNVDSYSQVEDQEIVEFEMPDDAPDFVKGEDVNFQE